MRTSTIAAAAFGLIAPVIADDGASSPNGNPFSAPGNTAAKVIAGKPYPVVWKAEKETRNGKCENVDLELLQGPNSGALNVAATLASNIPNSGAFTWTPAADSKLNVFEYGLKLVCKESKDYQYTDLFAIYKDDSAVPTANTTTAGPTGYPTGSVTTAAPNSTISGNATKPHSTEYTTAIITHLTTYCPEPTTLTIDHKTYTITSATTLTISDCSCKVTYTKEPVHEPSTKSATSLYIPTPYPIPHNTTIVQPTGTVTLPTADNTTPVSPQEPTSTRAAETTAPVYDGAASSIKTSFVGAFAVVVIAALAL